VRADLEGHDDVRGVVVDVVLRARVLEHHPLARLVLGEVDDDLVALGHADAEVVDRLRVGHEAAVGADDGQRLSGVQREVEGAADRRVEEPEAVLARLHRHQRPRLAVGQDDVAVDPGLAVVVDDQLAAALEHRVLERHRHVVAAVRDRQRELVLVVQDVLAGEAHVGVLGRDVHAVVVVPERAGVLLVRVPVVLVLPGVRDVRGVAVVLGQRAGPVQVG
jgi:hypothetical protein